MRYGTRCWIALLFAACGSEQSSATELMVTIDIEDALRDSAASVLIEVEGRADFGDTKKSAIVFDASVKPDELPKRIALVPADGDEERAVVVTATALDQADRSIAQGRLVSGYVSGEIRYARLLLQDACMGVGCHQDTCSDGWCSEAKVNADSLSSDESHPTTPSPCAGNTTGTAMCRAGIIDAQEAYLKASNTGMNDFFGYAVAIAGDTAVVGAPGEASGATTVDGNQADQSAPFIGAAYVFVRSGDEWVQEAYLKASNAGANDSFGTSVAISGDTIAVGAPMEASGVMGNALDNNAAECGAAYVFVRSGNTWTQQGYIKGSYTKAGDHFGFSIAILDDTLAIGAPGDANGSNSDPADVSAPDSGAVYVFGREGSAWTQQAYLNNVQAGESFGISMALSYDTLAIGVPFDARGPDGMDSYNSGAVHVFKRFEGKWGQPQYLKPNVIGTEDRFGWSVAISDNTILVGAPGEDSGTTGVDGDASNGSVLDSGAAYVFGRSESAWVQHHYLKASNPGEDDRFGWSLAIANDVLVVGAVSEDSGAADDQSDNGTEGSGAAYLFTRGEDGWKQDAYLKASNPGATDAFAVSAAVSGDTFLIGAEAEDSGAKGINGEQDDNRTSGSGAAYVLRWRPRR